MKQKQPSAKPSASRPQIPTQMDDITKEIKRHVIYGNNSISQTLGWTIGEEIRNREGAFDEMWEDVVPLLNNTQPVVLTPLFSDIVESEIYFNHPGRASKFLEALGRENLIENVVGKQILLANLALGKELGGRRVKHTQAAWPACLKWVQECGEDGDEIKLVESLSFTLIDLAMRGPLQRQLLDTVLSSTKTSEDTTHKDEGGLIGVWARVIARGNNIVEEPQEALDLLVHWGADIEQKDKDGNTPLEKTLFFLIDSEQNPYLLENQKDRAQMGIDALLTSGAQWLFVEDEKYAAIKDMVYSHPRVRSHRLGLLAAQKTDKHSKPKM